MSITVTKDVFGQDVEGNTVHRYILKNEAGFSVHVIDYGATITQINVPQGDEPPVDVVLGFDNMEGYLSEENPYFGATVGRVANRTKPTKFVFEGSEVSLSQNKGDCHLHGGIKGFDKVIWDTKVLEGNKVMMTYTSPDGEEGYPGTVTAVTSFDISPNNTLLIQFKAKTDKATLINLTNHSYFNLAGHNSGPEELMKHEVKIEGNEITKLNIDLVAKGEKMDVTGTAYDFRSTKVLGDAMNSIAENGFDVNYCLTPESSDLKLAATVSYGTLGLKVYTTVPGVQFYTSNFIENIKGKEGAIYKKHSAFCLETQHFPNAANVKSFPSITLLPGEEYLHKAVYKFSRNI